MKGLVVSTIFTYSLNNMLVSVDSGLNFWILYLQNVI